MSYAELRTAEPNLVRGPQPDGHDADGRAFSIRRDTSRTTGKVYDCVFVVGLDAEARCTEVTAA